MESIEKRKYERSEVFLTVQFRPYHKKGEFSTGVSSNMSIDGFHLESIDAADSGEILEIVVTHLQNQLSCSFLGKVVWKRQSWYKYMMGIKIYEIDEENAQKKSAILSTMPKYAESFVQSGDAVHEPECEQTENHAIKTGPGTIDDLMMQVSDAGCEDTPSEVSEHEDPPPVERKAYLEVEAESIGETRYSQAGEEPEIKREQPHYLQSGEIRNKVRDLEISQLNKEEKSRKRTARWAFVIPGLVAGVLAIVLAVPSGNFNKGAGNLIPSHTESVSREKFNGSEREISYGNVKDMVMRVNAADTSEELQSSLPVPNNDFGYMYDLELTTTGGMAAKTETATHTMDLETDAAADDKGILKYGPEDRKEKPAGLGSPDFTKNPHIAEATETGIDKPHAGQSDRSEQSNGIERKAEPNKVVDTAAAYRKEESIRNNAATGHDEMNKMYQSEEVKEAGKFSLTRARKMIWSAENPENENTAPTAGHNEGIQTEVSENHENPAAAETVAINKKIKKSQPVAGEEENMTASEEGLSGTPGAVPSGVKRGQTGEEGLSQSTEVSVRPGPGVRKGEKVASELTADNGKSPLNETAGSQEKPEKTLSAAVTDKGHDKKPAETNTEKPEVKLLRHKEGQSETVRSNRSRIPNISLVVTGTAP